MIGVDANLGRRARMGVAIQLGLSRTNLHFPRRGGILADVARLVSEQSPASADLLFFSCADISSQTHEARRIIKRSLVAQNDIFVRPLRNSRCGCDRDNASS